MRPDKTKKGMDKRMKKASADRENECSSDMNSEVESERIESDVDIAEENSSGEKKKAPDESRPAYLARLVAVLTVICVVIAVLLASVNALTRDKIKENTVRAKTDSVLSIFTAANDCELYRTEEDGSEIYIVYRDDGIVGYCVYVSSVGFGGNIDMMVGINSEYATVGVKIVSMSETPGVGSKTDSDDFLSQFKDKLHDAPTKDVDAISGATISSNAIMSGVLKAHAIDVKLDEIAAEKQKTLLLSSDIDQIINDTGNDSTDTSADTESVPEDTTGAPSADTEPAETSVPETSAPKEAEDIPLREQRRQQSHGYPVLSTEIDPTAQIEIPLAEETAPIETETDEESDE